PPRPRRPPVVPYTTLFRSPLDPGDPYPLHGRVAHRPCLAPDPGGRPRLRRPRNDRLMTDDQRPERPVPNGKIVVPGRPLRTEYIDRKSTRLNSSHVKISYA